MDNISLRITLELHPASTAVSLLTHLRAINMTNTASTSITSMVVRQITVSLNRTRNMLHISPAREVIMASKAHQHMVARRKEERRTAGPSTGNHLMADRVRNN
jgi:hypothetical protein